MIRTALLRFGWLVALLALFSFFLPWVVFRHPLGLDRHHPGSTLALSSELAAEADRPWYQAFLLPEPQEFHAALARPLEGESAFVIAKEAQSAAPADRHRTAALSKIFSLPDPRVAGLIVYAIPAAAILGIVLLSFGLGRIPLLLLGLLSGGAYVLIRLRVNETFLDRATSGVATGIGLWIALWALFLSAAIVLLSSLATGKK
ncbi:hypothetical protein SAMN05444156_2529 [Verrucomicrobium sp. GAS474]|uniref:hypothetical protein n=1 Tax=Verrucomicrobium sp. GAS474 TaxID=1882831 RepID=UPI00087AB340|nr:hypothetical protein [Verrucomicrobium sp. GAS474]SDU19467.1 hypothetical protein SAMN05444156_2529 [Verrucomicrobium sp. GAS474]